MNNKKSKLKSATLTLTITGLISACSTLKAPDDTLPFGGPTDVTYANALWQVMQQQKLVGDGARTVEPIVGAAPPHGWILEILDQKLKVADHEGFLIVKRNYNDPNPDRKDHLTIDEVKHNREKFLGSITIMYQRETGYDSDNRDWFWAKYKPDGSLYAKSKMGMTLPLAGRIAKGKTPDENAGCLYCHRSAGGGDYIFYPDIKAELH